MMRVPLRRIRNVECVLAPASIPPRARFDLECGHSQVVRLGDMEAAAAITACSVACHECGAMAEARHRN